MEVGPPLRGPTEENRLLLGAVALSPAQSGTTGPSLTRSVTTRSCQHTGPTRTMTTHYGSQHSGPTDDGPTDDGPQLRGPTEESPSPMGTTASSPSRSNTAESNTSRRSHQQNSPRLDGPRLIDPAPRPISSRLGLSPPQMADVSNGPGPNDPATIRATALALLDRAESCTSSRLGRTPSTYLATSPNDDMSPSLPTSTMTKRRSKANQAMDESRSPPGAAASSPTQSTGSSTTSRSCQRHRPCPPQP